MNEQTAKDTEALDKVFEAEFQTFIAKRPTLQNKSSEDIERARNQCYFWFLKGSLATTNYWVKEGVIK